MKDRLETQTQSEKGTEAQKATGEILLRDTDQTPGTPAQKKETESLSKNEVEKGNLPELNLILESDGAEPSDPRGESAETSAEPRGESAETSANAPEPRNEGLATDGESPLKTTPSGEGNDGTKDIKVEEPIDAF